MSTSTQDQGRQARPAAMWQFFVYSAIGFVMFFVPVSLGGTRTIGLDHIVSWVQAAVPAALPWYALVLVAGGAAYPFVVGKWRRTPTQLVFSVAKIIGLVVAVMMVFEVGPAWLFEPGMGPFLFDKLVIAVGLLVPIGAVFLALLVGYGLMEFIGVLMQPIMRPLFRTPGRSAVDAVASFVGSYSLALLITNRVYLQGKYSRREALIIGTGFSTVSATFMIVVAKTLGLMEHWSLYFWSTLLITFAVTAIVVHLPPLSRTSTECAPGVAPQPEEVPQSRRLSAAWAAAREAVAEAPGVGRNVALNLRDGFVMAMAILPAILSIGLLGLVLAEYTPVFDWLGYLFLPVTWAMQLPEPLLAAKAAALGISEMFLPAVLVAEAAMPVKYVIGVVSLSQIIFFSALVPSLMATEIPVSIPKLLIIWVERVFLSLILAIPVGLVFFG